MVDIAKVNLKNASIIYLIDKFLFNPLDATIANDVHK
jgi:hypothetical protein